MTDGCSLPSSPHMHTSHPHTALVFGKKLSPKAKVRVHSASLAWSGSDSSIDSMPGSSSSEGEADWPEHTGYQVGGPPLHIHVCF